jgi:hypothetical protein
MLLSFLPINSKCESPTPCKRGARGGAEYQLVQKSSKTLSNIEARRSNEITRGRHVFGKVGEQQNMEE